jgi:hypothetical protein
MRKHVLVLAAAMALVAAVPAHAGTGYGYPAGFECLGYYTYVDRYLYWPDRPIRYSGYPYCSGILAFKSTRRGGGAPYIGIGFGRW